MYSIPEEYVMRGKNMYYQLVHEFEFSPQERRLLDYLEWKLIYGTIDITESTNEIARSLGIDKTNCSRLMGKLKEKGLIKKKDWNRWVINPLFAFKGKQKDWNKELERWHTINYIPGQKQQKQEYLKLARELKAVV